MQATLRYEYVQLLMGVRVRIIAYAADEASARAACKAAFERVAQLEDIMSDYLPDSELMRLSRRSPTTRPVPVSRELFEVLAYAQEVSAQTDGAFDVTVGPLVKLWRRARKTAVMPTPAELAAARSTVGWRHLRLDPQSSSVELLVSGMLLDLGGIAKGYAGDEAIRVLREHGIHSALFEAGGDIVVSDAPPAKPGWEIETQTPGEKFALRDAAISTSGDTEQFVVIDGVRYSHVVDPRTGLGLTDHYAATVIAPRGITTDSLSTAVTLVGPSRADALFRHFQARGFLRKMAPQTSSSTSSTTSR